VDFAVGHLRGPRVALVALDPSHAAAIRAIRATPQVARRWPDDEGFPLTDEPDAVRYVVLLGDDPQPRGLVQYGEDDTPDYRHASIDIFLDPEVHGHGYGREVVAVLAAHLVDDRGHHRITIDPAADNAAAIACYAAVGFRPVGIMRRYERGPDGTFHDGLLMDLLAGELVRAH
jgi:RimJ/RimL family protein N-acetyltransferase